MPRTIAVIDGNSLMHRAYHAVPPTMNAPDGTPTNAVFGFMNMLLKFIDTTSPDAIVCAFDVGKPQFRIDALEQYKAQRPPMDDDLRVQFPLVDALLESMAIPVVKVPGWEGDDILGTVSARAEAAGWDVLLVTGDKDACQLASERTRIVNTKKGITDIVVFDPQGVREKYGVGPEQIPDFLGLMGDTSDNIPGVPGVGPKGAAKLLAAYGSLEGIYEHLDELRGKQLENLRDNREAAFLSRRVATIVRDLDFELDLDAVSWPSFQPEAVEEAFGRLALRAPLAKVLAYRGVVTQVPRVELAWEGYARGDAAQDFVREAAGRLDAGTVGVACGTPEQESLFGSTLQLAVATADGAALLEGDEALAALEALVRASAGAARAVAVFDAKAVLGHLYPPDTASPARIDDEALFAARLFDVTLAAYALDSSAYKYDFSYLAQRYLDGDLPETAAPEDALVVQAAAIRALAKPLREALEADDTYHVYEQIDAPLVPVLARMERIGTSIDADTLRAMGEQTQDEIDALVAQIYELAGEEFNIDSPKQVGRILFEVIGLKPRKKTARGYSTDAKVLGELSAEHELPGLILRYRELAKMKSTYLDALPALRAGDGRLHTSFNETVTATGRLSSSDPNLQNIPVRTDFGRRVRQCFVPNRAGDVFLAADYSQIELRLLAHLSGDEGLIAAFNHGEDFHAETAARVFGIPVEQVTPQLRSRAKAVNFGIVYGQQAYGLSQSLHIPFGEAQEMIDRYFQAYPGVRAYLDQVVAQAKERGFAATMAGRKRHIPELAMRNQQQRAFGERTAMNHPMQGSAADIIKKAMVQVDARLRAEFPQAQLLLQVHDELDLSVPAAEAEGVAALLRDVMENVERLRVPLIVDVQWGANWSEAH